MKAFAFVLLFGMVSTSLGAYRVFELKVFYYDKKGTKLKRIETVLTNLDPYQYEQYYRFSAPIRIQAVDSWYCPGDTGQHREYCPKPKVPSPNTVENRPSSLNSPKRPYLPRNRQPVIP